MTIHTIRSKAVYVSPPEDYDKIRNDRDVLLSILEGAQKREAIAARTLELLIIAGHVTEVRVRQAKELAQ